MLKILLILLSSILYVLQTPLYSQEDVAEKSLSETLFPSSKILYAKYVSFPKEVHTKERFEVKIEATVLLPSDEAFSLFTDIPDVPELEKITDEIIWYKKEGGKYEATLVFKAKNNQFNFPVIGLSVLNQSNVAVDKTLLVLDSIKFKSLPINKDLYTNVTASNLEIQNIKIKQYSNNELLCSMEIHGTNSNLSEFKIPKYLHQGRKELVNKGGGQEVLYYFVILPIDTEILQFDYYNSIQKAMTTLEVPIVLEEDLVSTQTGLNPNEGNMGFYKQVFFAFMMTVFFMIYYYKRSKVYLFIAIGFSLILIKTLLPNSHIILKKNEKVYILPTPNSTVFKVIQEEEDVEVLMEQDEFKKVLFKNDNIGWVKNE